MAYNYLDLTNEVLARFNEVPLTSTTFNNSRGFQTQCKNAVNDALNYINQREFNWPFNHATETEVLVPGNARYTIPTNAKTVDYETFRIVRDESLGAGGRPLRSMTYYEYLERYIDQEQKTDVGTLPTHVARTLDNNFLLYPYPDKAYSLTYEYFIIPAQLSAATDSPTIPEHFRRIIADGATAYGYQYRGEANQYAINFERFEKGITQMQSLVLNRHDYVRSTVIDRSSTFTQSKVV